MGSIVSNENLGRPSISVRIEDNTRIPANLMLNTLPQHKQIFGRILNVVPKEPKP